jgi:hypothetical protein
MRKYLMNQALASISSRDVIKDEPQGWVKDYEPCPNFPKYA